MFETWTDNCKRSVQFNMYNAELPSMNFHDMYVLQAVGLWETAFMSVVDEGWFASYGYGINNG